jgi:hypothetical protein
VGCDDAVDVWALGPNAWADVRWRERDSGMLCPSAGLTNQAGAGKTGNILIKTVVPVVNGSYAVTLFLRKTTA